MASKIALLPARHCLRAARLCVPKNATSAPRWATGRAFSVVASSRAKMYTKDHEWIEISSDKKIATVGITKYAANALGDVVFVELPEMSLEVKAGDSIGAVESVKSASDIMTPISGTIIERNDVLEDKAKLLNEDPEGEAWFAKIEVGDSVQAETSELMDEAGYKEFTEESS